MEIVFLVLLAAAIGVLFLPIKAREKNSTKSRYRGAGAVLFAINEVFSPSAANASVIAEEQREARKAIPSPEDKPN